MSVRYSREVRCTPPRKHVIEKGKTLCDCGAVTAGPTAARNATVVTILDPVQLQALQQLRNVKL